MSEEVCIALKASHSAKVDFDFISDNYIHGLPPFIPISATGTGLVHPDSRIHFLARNYDACRLWCPVGQVRKRWQHISDYWTMFRDYSDPENPDEVLPAGADDFSRHFLVVHPELPGCDDDLRPTFGKWTLERLSATTTRLNGEVREKNDDRETDDYEQKLKAEYWDKDEDDRKAYRLTAPKSSGQAKSVFMSASDSNTQAAWDKLSAASKL